MREGTSITKGIIRAKHFKYQRETEADISKYRLYRLCGLHSLQAGCS